MKNLITEIRNTNFSKELDKTNESDKKKYLILITWEIILIILVVLIQYFLRPKKIVLPYIDEFLLGTLPSLFGSSGYVAILFVAHRIVKIKHKNYSLWKSLFFSNLFTFFGFTFWEFIRMLIHPFDIYDILMTFVGCIFSTLLILYLFKKEANAE